MHFYFENRYCSVSGSYKRGNALAFFSSNQHVFFFYLRVELADMAVDWLGYGYAALITIGGIFGYVKAGKMHATNDCLVFWFSFGVASTCKNTF